MSNITKKGDIARLLLAGANKVGVYEEETAVASGGSTTTIVLSAPALSADTDYVLWAAECIYATNTANVGKRRLITACAHGTSTLTVDAFPAAVSAGDKFRLAQLDIATFVEDTGGSSSQISDVANRTESNDYFNNAYLVALAADNVAKQYKCTDFGSGVATVSGLEGNTAIGDAFIACRYFPGKVTGKMENQDIIVGGTPGDLGVIRKVPGQLIEASASFSECWIQGCGTLPAAAATASPSYSHQLMRAGLVERAVAAVAIDSGSTTTVINVADTAAANLQVNDLVVINHKARRITAISTAPVGHDEVTISPALPAAPVATDLIIPMRMYYAKSGATSERVGVEFSYGDRESWILGGGVFSPVLQGERNKLVELSGDLQAEYCISRPTISYPSNQIDSTGFISGDRAWLYIDGTQYTIRDWKFDFGLKYQKKNSKHHPNQNYGFELTEAAPVLTATLLLDANSYVIRESGTSGKTYTVLLEVGDIAGNPGKIAVLMKDCYIETDLPDADSVYHVSLTCKPTIMYDYDNSISNVILGLL